MKKAEGKAIPSAQEILRLLAEKHAGDVFVPECKDGPTQSGPHLRLDAWVMPRSWSKPAITGYEIKRTRADFLRDTKWPRYLELCNQLYFVTPPGIASLEELPREVGLMEVAKTGTRLMTKRRAAYRDVQIPESVFRYVLMCRSQIVGEMKGENRSLEFWREWLARKRERQEVGHRVARRLRELYDENVTRVETESYRLRSQHERLEKAIEVLDQLGVRWKDGWGVEEDVRRKVIAHRSGLHQDAVLALEAAEKAIVRLRGKLDEGAAA